jgi:hypothetical protein
MDVPLQAAAALLDHAIAEVFPGLYFQLSPPKLRPQVRYITRYSTEGQTINQRLKLLAYFS